VAEQAEVVVLVVRLTQVISLEAEVAVLVAMLYTP
jgi:hypothetical protein